MKRTRLFAGEARCLRYLDRAEEVGDKANYGIVLLEMKKHG